MLLTVMWVEGKGEEGNGEGYIIWGHVTVTEIWTTETADLTQAILYLRDFFIHCFPVSQWQ